MAEIGYALSSEEHRPSDLVRYAVLAEEAGFTFAGLSDHYHPWTSTQGQAGFVWGTLGAIAQATERLRVGTGVTCPTVRIHPAIIAQAAATAADLMPGRFFLGVGTGEALNEHILGDPWPPLDVRLEMLEDAVEVIRELWKGNLTTLENRHYVVHNARVYTLPEELPPIVVAASGGKSTEVAARIGDGIWGTTPDAEMLEQYGSQGGTGMRIGEMTVCWAATEDEAVRTATEMWPNLAIPGQLGQDLPLPSHFESAAELVTEDMVREAIPVGPDPDQHLSGLREYLDAGYDHVYVHQIGPDQEGFLRFWRDEVAPKVNGT
ncbi:MAG TPA: TIGR03557 family F420-dependent LLM class oxidoreductase [Acidimicrobiales bacterium]|jgi:G6PDH family F420-dependent oxidoreductase